MLIISKAQMAQLGAHSRNDFVQRTVAFLKVNTPQWAAGSTVDNIVHHILKSFDTCFRHSQISEAFELTLVKLR